MRTLALVLLAASLAAPALAGDPQSVADGIKQMKSRFGARCEGPNGRRKYMHLILYQQNRVVGTPFTNDIRSNASIALIAHNVELMKPPETPDGLGGDQLFSYPKDADCERRSAEDKKKDPLCAIAIEDQIAFCQVVREAFAAHAPPPGYLPVFELWFGGSLKKQIGQDVAGQTYPKGSFKARCAVVGEDSGIPETAFAVVDVRPDIEMKQVLIHEMGHSIGHSVGKPAWFEDQYPGENAPADTNNIMASRKALSDPLAMEMSAFQVQALCSSPYVSDTP